MFQSRRQIFELKFESGFLRFGGQNAAAFEKQALAHLVQNAIDASPNGAAVRMRCGRRGGEAAIEIVDRGEGMSADFIRTRLFQPFASTKENGFGVGAFEARSLIAAMGGRIEVDSREGEGTRFRITLPAADMMEVAA